MKDNRWVLENALIVMNVLNKKERMTHQLIKTFVDANLFVRVCSNKTGYWKVI